MFSILAALTFITAIASPTADTPAREPQLAVHGSTIALTFGAGHAIYFAKSNDSGKTFGPAVAVGEGAIVPLTRHRGPRLVFSGSYIVITAVVGNTAATGEHAHGLPSDGDLVAWRSTDGGKTWSPGVRVNDVSAAATEGLHGLGADDKGNLFAAWLDKRKGTTVLYGARSTDHGKTWSRNLPVYDSPEGSICQCCHPSVAFDTNGGVVVMWRNWLNGSRDMYLARSNDGTHFSSAQKLGENTWKLNACPMDGGGIAVSPATGVVTAWRREHKLYLAKPGEPEREIGEGTDVAVAAGRLGIYAIWATPASIELLRPKQNAPNVLATKGAFPAIASLSNGGAIAAWEAEGKILLHLVE